MKVYEFHFFDDADRRPLLDFHPGDDDAAAIRAAADQLTRHASCHGVEIHEADRFVARLERTASESI